MGVIDQDYAERTTSRDSDNSAWQGVCKTAFAAVCGLMLGLNALAYNEKFPEASDPDQDGTYDMQVSEAPSSPQAFQHILSSAKRLQNVYNQELADGHVQSIPLEQNWSGIPEEDVAAIHSLKASVQSALEEGRVSGEAFDTVNSALEDLQETIEQYGSSVKLDYKGRSSGPGALTH